MQAIGSSKRQSVTSKELKQLVLSWLSTPKTARIRDYSENKGNWYLHDMALLSVCSGLEAKALSLLSPDWFKLDLGILRVYDKLVSGVLDAKTQNRARDIPLTGWQLIRVSRMLGHSSINTTASHYAEYDLSESPQGFEGMVKVYGEFVQWLDMGYFEE